MNDFADWVGREEQSTDRACPYRTAGLMALLDKPGPLPDLLPPLAHWLLAPSMARQSELDFDGHPRRGGDALLPLIALPRRMWAGSELKFDNPLRIDATIVRHTRIAAIEAKTGRSGAMVFVTLEHDIRSEGVSAIRERQRLVYREAAAAPASQTGSARRSDEIAPPAGAIAWYTADPIALFRYSALTFNAHRIHYDREYAESEGYPGLVVHGPFLATLLLDHAQQQHPGATVSRFSFRAQAPIIADTPFMLAMDRDRLWIVDADGATAMTAEIFWA